MINSPSYISGLEVICSGSVVLNQGDFLEIFPFASDPIFKVQIRIDFKSELNNAEIDFDYVGDKTAVFVIARKFMPSATISTSEPIEFAEEDDKLSDYLASMAVVAFGNAEKHTAILNYTILKKQRTQGSR